MLTLEELKERLAARFSEDDLLELLKVTSADLVEVFTDRIEEQQDMLREELDEGEEIDNDSV